MPPGTAYSAHAAPSPLVGEPVYAAMPAPVGPAAGMAVAGQEARPLTDPEEPEAAAKFYGQWHDGLCDCHNDPGPCIAACLCFDCFLLWRVYKIVDRSRWLDIQILGRAGRDNACTVLLVLILLLIFDSYATEVSMKSAAKLTVHTDEHGKLVWNVQDNLRDPAAKAQAEAMLSIAFVLNLMFRYALFEAVSSRFRIPGDGIDLFKVCCCGCCTYLRMGRHVDRYHETCAYAARYS